MGVQNLIVEFNFVFEAIFASVETFDSLFFIAVDGHLGLFALERPRLLVVQQLLRLVETWGDFHGLSHFAN